MAAYRSIGNPIVEIEANDSIEKQVFYDSMRSTAKSMAGSIPVYFSTTNQSIPSFESSIVS
jgi:hypothetical protein